MQRKKNGHYTRKTFLSHSYDSKKILCSTIFFFLSRRINRITPYCSSSTINTILSIVVLNLEHNQWIILFYAKLQKLKFINTCRWDICVCVQWKEKKKWNKWLLFGHLLKDLLTYWDACKKCIWTERNILIAVKCDVEKLIWSFIMQEKKAEVSWINYFFNHSTIDQQFKIFRKDKRSLIPIWLNEKTNF